MSRLNNMDLTPLTGTVVGVATMILEKLDAKILTAVNYNTLASCVSGPLSKVQLQTLYKQYQIAGDDRGAFVYHLFTRNPALISKSIQEREVYTQRLYKVSSCGKTKTVASVDFRPYMLDNGVENALVTPIAKTLTLDKVFVESIGSAMCMNPNLLYWFMLDSPDKTVEQVQGQFFLEDYCKLRI